MRPRRLLSLPRRWILKARYGVIEWRELVRDRRASRMPTLDLEPVRRRLEVLLAAVYGRSIPIAPLEIGMWNRSTSRRLLLHSLRAGAPIGSVDGDMIFLPPKLADSASGEALTRYRLLALEQAERLVRGTAEVALPEDRLERDLYLLREGATIDARIAQHNRGVAELLWEERRTALARRPKIEGLTLTEQEVETRFRELLSSRPEELDSPSPSPEDSLQWARDTARTIRSLGSKYRGLPLASIWGAVKTKTLSPTQSADERSRDDARRIRLQAGGAQSLETSPRPGDYPNRARGQQNPDEADATSEATRKKPSESGSPERSSGPRRPAADQPAGGTWGNEAGWVASEHQEHLPPAIYYDEWNSDRCVYVKRAAAVRLYAPGSSNPAWMHGTLAEHGATVRRIRHQFERLRARRARLRRQCAGADFDIAEYVNTVVDRRAGRSADDRLYIDARPARRGLAIALLVDASGSTSLRVSETMRIIDIERIALLLSGEALDALGDQYAIYTFSGRGPTNVKVTVVKDFAEGSGPVIHERIAAIEPEGHTRLGAAVRHATTQLARHSAGHRLLLILSDGRPHDTDQYQGPYGVEDTRQAVLEARRSGVFPYCLTVDREASEYLPRIFGKAGHTILQRPEQLPQALLSVVRGLIGGH